VEQENQKSTYHLLLLFDQDQHEKTLQLARSSALHPPHNRQQLKATTNNEQPHQPPNQPPNYSPGWVTHPFPPHPPHHGPQPQPYYFHGLQPYHHPIQPNLPPPRPRQSITKIEAKAAADTSKARQSINEAIAKAKSDAEAKATADMTKIKSKSEAEIEKLKADLVVAINDLTPLPNCHHQEAKSPKQGK
jgi:hypothetical protein